MTFSYSQPLAVATPIWNAGPTQCLSLKKRSNPATDIWNLLTCLPSPKATLEDTVKHCKHFNQLRNITPPIKGSSAASLSVRPNYVNTLSPCHWSKVFGTVEASSKHSSLTGCALVFEMNAKQIILMSRLERTHWWYKSTHELVDACVRRFAGVGQPIFDAGCGTGGLLKTLSKTSPVSGCDTSELSLRLARGHSTPKNRLDLQKYGVEELQYGRKAKDLT